MDAKANNIKFKVPRQRLGNSRNAGGKVANLKKQIHDKDANSCTFLVCYSFAYSGLDDAKNKGEELPGVRRISKRAVPPFRQRVALWPANYLLANSPAAIYYQVVARHEV